MLLTKHYSIKIGSAIKVTRKRRLQVDCTGAIFDKGAKPNGILHEHQEVDKNQIGTIGFSYQFTPAIFNTGFEACGPPVYKLSTSKDSFIEITNDYDPQP